MALAQTVTFLESHRDQSGIIYCSTRKQVDELAQQLSLARLAGSALSRRAGERHTPPSPAQIHARGRGYHRGYHRLWYGHR